MKIITTLTLLLPLMLSTLCVTCSVKAQEPKASRPQPAATNRGAKETPLTIETMLAADTYKIYGEIRNVGQVIRSASIADVIEPIMKLAGPPREFKQMVRFANDHAETLENCRLVFAGWPVRPGIPQFMFAIEFASPEDARKFEPELRGFLPKVIPPSTPTPAQAEGPGKSDTASAEKPRSMAATTEVKAASAEAKAAQDKPVTPPYQIKQSGSLVVLSDTTFTLNNLRPKDSKLLVDDESFRQARDRFASDPVFLFFNVALEPQPTGPAYLPEKHADAKLDPKSEQTNEPDTDENDPEEMNPGNAPKAEPGIVVSPAGDPGNPRLVQEQSNVTLTARSSGPNFDPGMALGMLFNGEPKWPDAVGAAISFEGDTYVVHVLAQNGPNAKGVLIPIMPQILSGPPIVLEAPSILPADSEIVISASIDGPMIYENAVKQLNEQNARFQQAAQNKGRQFVPELPFASLEKQLGIKIKDDLLPVLGNELAISIPIGPIIGMQPKPTPQSDQKTENDKSAPANAAAPIILISLKDKEAAHKLIPRLLDNFGFKGASMLAQAEKKDDTELVTFGGAFGYAYIGDFLLLSENVTEVRHVIDSYLKHETLASDSHFRNSTRWLPRQLIGQVYVSPKVVEAYRGSANEPSTLMSDQLREFLSHINPVAEPVTYAVSNEGAGPLHVLHVPKNLLQMAVAGISAESNQPPETRNESIARAALSIIAESEMRYREDQGKGSFATLDQLTAAGMVSKDFWTNNGYKVELTINGDKFQATAMPIEYGKTGKLSYFIDETRMLRGGDHGGAPANLSDARVQ